MTKLQMIMEIVTRTDDYSVEQLRKLWYTELRVLRDSLVNKDYKLDEYQIDKEDEHDIE